MAENEARTLHDKNMASIPDNFTYYTNDGRQNSINASNEVKLPNKGRVSGIELIAGAFIDNLLMVKVQGVGKNMSLEANTNGKMLLGRFTHLLIPRGATGNDVIIKVYWTQ